MKLIHIAASALVALASLVMLPSCDEELDRPPLDIPHTTTEANTTILDLKTRYWQSDRNFAVEITPTVAGGRVIIGGRVIASDSTGNIYKTVYLQDKTSAVAIAVDTTKLYLRYKEGEEMYIDVTGLYAGKYNGLFQIGERQAYGTGYETSQMAGSTFYNRSSLNGLPKPQELDTIVTTMARIKEWGRNQDSIARYVGQLIRLDGVAFEGGGELTWSDFGANSNRTLIDGRGNSLTVRNSAYATFSQMTMPAGTGSVVAILSYYGTDWQLLMRSQTGAFGFSGDPADIPGAKPARYRLSSSKPAPGTRFIMVADGNKVVIPIAASYTYGYLYVEDPLASDSDIITARETSEMTFLAGESDATRAITDSYGRYLAMDDVESHRSFQLYAAPQAGCYWTVTPAEKGWTLTNTLRGMTIRWASNYSNYAPSTDASQPLPVIYVRVD
ncbi:MAG: DUF5689 domain-containing protein [Pseudoflavonifractor sp.]|nr:DUF5689 domain-containing protein [Alloprevotella sp.]MCM1116948.1 DUF5689 domain-containing protein [Pseudoflavonifractor sp.]